MELTKVEQAVLIEALRRLYISWNDPAEIAKDHARINLIKRIEKIKPKDEKYRRFTT